MTIATPHLAHFCQKLARIQPRGQFNGRQVEMIMNLYADKAKSALRCRCLRARVAWAHDWVSNPTLSAVFQTLPGASFIVNGAAAPKNPALASAGRRTSHDRQLVARGNSQP
jgi:hypothetical protein